MEITRLKEMVEAFHYDARNPEPPPAKPNIQVGFAPLTSKDPNYPKENSIIGVRLEFRLEFADYILSGRISQINHFINRIVRAQEDLTSDEVDELVHPLFNIVERMALEVTEIAKDEPGVKLNFESANQREKKEE